MGLFGMGVFGTIAVILLAVLIILFGFGYLKAPPDTAFVISGLGKKRILIHRLSAA